MLPLSQEGTHLNSLSFKRIRGAHTGQDVRPTPTGWPPTNDAETHDNQNKTLPNLIREIEMPTASPGSLVLEVRINNQNAEGVVDTGSQVCVISEELFGKIHDAYPQSIGPVTEVVILKGAARKR